MVEELLFVTYEQAVYIADTTQLVHLERSLHIEACQPGPCRALMVCIVALYLRSHIHGVVAAALGRERTQTFGSEQLFGAVVEDTLLLLFI